MATKNDIFSHIYTIETALSSVPIRKGQIIVCTDSGKLYIDTASKRIHTNDVVRVDSFSSLPLAPLDKLYITIDTGKIYLYINDEWQPIVTEDEFSYAVRRYEATIDPESQQVVITDGTPVTDLRIGDEIVTADGVYKKTKDEITTGSPADGTRIEVSGITNPSGANGVYVLQSENVWKHETENYWITVFSSSGWYWMISNRSNPANPSESLFYAFTATGEPGNPWDVTGWDSMPVSSGTPVLENVASEQTVTDTIDLFEYASLPIEPENIVQSVNGNKPDAEGNVTIEIPPAGLESVTTGDGLAGSGTAEDPVKLELSNYTTSGSIMLTSEPDDPTATISLKNHYTDASQGGSGGVVTNSVDWSNNITLSDDGVNITSDTSITLNISSLSQLILKTGSILPKEGAANEADGLAVVGSNGKLPESILPTYVKTVNGITPDDSGNVTIDLPDGGLTSVSVSSGLTGNGTSGSPIALDLSNYTTDGTIRLAKNSTDCKLEFNSSRGTTLTATGSTVVYGNEGTEVGSNATLSSTTIKVGSLDLFKLQVGEAEAASANTAKGFAIVGSDGKLPSSILPDSSIDLSDYSTTSNISLKTTGSSTGITLGSTNGTVSLYSGYDGNGLSIGSTSCSYSGGNVSLSGTLSTSVGSYGAGTTTINATSLTNLKLRIGSNGTASSANTANGLVVVGSDGKIPSSIIPESTVDLSSYTGALDITATSNASIRGGTSGNYDITIGDIGHGVTVYAAQNNPTVSITSFGSSGNIDLNSANINVGGSSGSTKITLKSSNVSVESSTGAGTFSVDVESSGSVKFTAGNIYFNSNASNTAGGFAIVEEDGKLPESILPVMNQTWTKVTLNQSDFSTTDDTYGGSYKELEGICTVEIYDADGFKVEFDLKCDFSNNKTRIYIPSSLAASSISNWTLLYTVKTIA